MAIYGTALLACCLIVGLAIGRLFGLVVGVEANVGGVGIAMLLLIVSTGWLRRRESMHDADERGVLFWSSIYVPVVVAMAASQNVVAALKGGPVAILAGLVVVLVSFALVPLIAGTNEPDGSTNRAELQDGMP